MRGPSVPLPSPSPCTAPLTSPVWCLGELCQQLCHKHSSFLTALGALGTHPGLDLRGQCVQELFQHQQFQHLLFGAHLRPQPLAAQLVQLGQSLVGTRCPGSRTSGSAGMQSRRGPRCQGYIPGPGRGWPPHPSLSHVGSHPVPRAPGSGEWPLRRSTPVRRSPARALDLGLQEDQNLVIGWNLAPVRCDSLSQRYGIKIIRIACAAQPLSQHARNSFETHNKPRRWELSFQFTDMKTDTGGKSCIKFPRY